MAESRRNQSHKDSRPDRRRHRRHGSGALGGRLDHGGLRRCPRGRAVAAHEPGGSAGGGKLKNPPGTLDIPRGWVYNNDRECTDDGRSHG